MQVDAGITDKDNLVLELESRSKIVRNALSAPQTKETSLATPIYASDKKVEPKRLIIILVSVFVGVCLSIIFLLGRQSLRRLQAQPTFN